MISSNLEFGFPTGDEKRELGSGEISISPSISTWLDLGNWFSLSSQLGFEHSLESEDTGYFYKMALGYSVIRHGKRKIDLDNFHFPSGMLNFIAEFSGNTYLTEFDETESAFDILLGAAYVVNPHWEGRVGYSFPIGGHQEFKRSVVFSLIRHF